MKSEIFSFIVLITAITAVSCNNNKVEVKEKQPALVESTLDIDERLKEADSLVVVFYKDPYGTDSVRYTRFYTQISVVDASSLELLRQQLAEKVIKEEQYRKCRGEGKIWCFSNGKDLSNIIFQHALR